MSLKEFSHANVDRDVWKKLYKRNSYNNAENLAFGETDSYWTIQHFENSPSHRAANHGPYTSVGFAICSNPKVTASAPRIYFEKYNKVITTQDFASDKTVVVIFGTNVLGEMERKMPRYTNVLYFARFMQLIKQDTQNLSIREINP